MANINQIISYQPDFSSVISGFKTLVNLNAALSKQLQADLGSAFNVTGLNVTKLTNTFDKLGNPQQIGKFSASVKDASGNLKTLSSDFVIAGQSGRGATAGINLLNQTIKDGGQASKIFGVNIGELAKRAALTIPIWFALRGAIIGIPQALAQGVKDLIDFDRELQKVKRNLTGSAGEIEQGFNRIRSEIVRLSLETGKSTTEIADAVKQFATLGFGVEDSLSGANAAVKASVLFFEDAGKTAKAFAGAMKILQDRTKGAANFSEQFNETLALAVELEKDNKSDLGPLSEALERFAPAALNAGISMRETITLLASLGTAGRGGAAGATLLRSSVNELLGSLDQLAPQLGVFVKESDSTFDVLLKVIDAGDKLANSGLIKDRAKVTEAFSNIFGGERGTQVVTALSSVNEQLRKNISVLPNINNFYKQYNDLLEKSSAVQRDKLNQGLIDLRKSFVNAVVGGGEGLLNLLKNLTKTIETVTPVLNTLGITINKIFGNLGLIAGLAFLIRFRATISVTALTSTFIGLNNAFITRGAILGQFFGRGFILGFIKNLGPNLIKAFAGGISGAGLLRVTTFLLNPLVAGSLIIAKIAADTFTENFVKGIEKADQKAQAAFNVLIQGLQGKLNSVDLTNLIVDIQAGKIDLGGANQIQVEGNLRKLLEERRKVESEIAKEKQFQNDISRDALSIDEKLFKLSLQQKSSNTDIIESLKEQLKLLNQQEAAGIVVDPKKIKDVQKSLLESLAGQQSEINNLLLSDAIERARAEGAVESQVLRITQAYRDQLGIDTSLTQKISDRLALERANSAEKRLQNKLSSDSVKLFDIAQTNGTEAAKAIGDVLAGNTSFETFFRQGGKNLEIFKTEFSDIFKNIQAQSFFQGDFLKGFQELRGGTNVAIADRGALATTVPRFDTNLALQQSKAQFDQLSQLQNINVQAALQIDITGLSFDRAKDKIVEEVATSVFNRIKVEANNPQSDFSQAVRTRFNEE